MGNALVEGEATARIAFAATDSRRLVNDAVYRPVELCVESAAGVRNSRAWRPAPRARRMAHRLATVGSEPLGLDQLQQAQNLHPENAELLFGPTQNAVIGSDPMSVMMDLLLSGRIFARFQAQIHRRNLHGKATKDGLQVNP